MSDLSTKTIKQLVDLHNEYASQEDQLTSWKGKKDLLIEKVKETVKKAKGSVTIKSVSVDLLLKTDHKDEDGRDVGLTYDAILEQVLEQFPGAETTVKCLRWYATHLNKDPSVKMPIRPRKKVVRQAKTETADTNTSEADTGSSNEE